MNILFKAECSILTYSQYLGKPWISAFTTVNAEETSLTKVESSVTSINKNV